MENEVYIQQTRRANETQWRRVGFFHALPFAEEDMERRARKSPNDLFRLVEYRSTGRLIYPPQCGEKEVDYERD